MSKPSWGKEISGNSSYPKGYMKENKENNCNDEWGDRNCSDHSLRVGFINIQTFPTSIHHHKNNNIRNLFHDYKLSAV